MDPSNVVAQLCASIRGGIDRNSTYQIPADCFCGQGATFVSRFEFDSHLLQALNYAVAEVAANYKRVLPNVPENISYQHSGELDVLLTCNTCEDEKLLKFEDHAQELDVLNVHGESKRLEFLDEQMLNFAQDHICYPKDIKLQLTINSKFVGMRTYKH